MNKGLVFLLVALVSGALAFLLGVMESEQKIPERLELNFVFRPPIPAEPLNLNKVTGPAEIREVFLSGTFNNWAEQDPEYRMKPQNQGVWELKLHLPPGQVQYKFVVFLQGRTMPVWTHDTTRPEKVVDGYGGYNSITAPDPRIWWYAPAIYILLAAALLSLLLSLMEWISLLVFRYGLSERVRTLVMIWLASVFAMGFALALNLDTQRQQARNTLLESLSLLHLSLSAKGEEKIPEAFVEAKDWFYRADARSNSRLFNNQQTILKAVFLLDREMKMVDFLQRQQDQGRIRYWVHKTGSSSPKVFYRNHLLKEILEAAGSGTITPTGFFGRENPKLQESLTPEALTATWLLGFNAVVVPYYRDLEVAGYYAAVIHPEVFSESMVQIIFMNLFWFLAVSLMVFVFFFVIPKPQEENRLRLERFSARFQLSTREKEVLACLVKGLSNQDIGNQLFISEGTVKVHVYKIYQKSGVSSRMELMDHLANVQ